MEEYKTCIRCKCAYAKRSHQSAEKWAKSKFCGQDCYSAKTRFTYKPVSETPNKNYSDYLREWKQSKLYIN